MSLFKTCPKCNKKWETRDSFLADPEIIIIGYQVNFRSLELGLFLFNHTDCKTTMSLEAKDFTDLYQGTIFKERKTGTDSCPEFCLNINNLQACPAQCECSYVRQVIQTVKSWQKSAEMANLVD